MRKGRPFVTVVNIISKPTISYLFLEDILGNMYFTVAVQT